MTQEELDSMPVGWIERDPHGVLLTKIADDYYQISDHYGNVTVCSSGTIHAITGGVPGSLGGVSISGSGITSAATWPPLPTISSAEKIELEKLEEEHRTYIKQNRLNKFKALPKHLRQEIVDEAYIRDLNESLSSDDDKDFPDLARLAALRNKNSHAWSISAGSGISISHQVFGHSISHSISKYENILRHFKTEELARAHAEVCLEEEIKD